MLGEENTSIILGEVLLTQACKDNCKVFPGGNFENPEESAVIACLHISVFILYLNFSTIVL